jgi:hypothetical protein
MANREWQIGNGEWRVRPYSPFATRFSRPYILLLTAYCVLLLPGCRQEPTPPADLFLAADRNGRDQLYRLEVDGDGPQAVTAAPFGVYDFAPRPGGGAVVYSAWREDGGSDLWLWEDGDERLLLACPAGSCRAPVWLPNGARLLFERRSLDDPAGPRLEWLALADGSVTHSLPTTSAEATRRAGRPMVPG